MTSKFSLLTSVIVVAALAVLLGGAGQAAASIIVNGGFETGDWTGWLVAESLPDQAFTADNGGFATIEVTPNGVWDGGTPWIAPHDGTYCAVLGGFETYGAYTDPVGDTLAQTVATTPGTSYTLSFWVNDGNDAPCQLVTSWNGSPIISLVWPPLGTTGAWTQYTTTVTGTGSDTLQFAGWGPAWFMGLDNVSLTAVPEPMTLSLLALGGLAMLRRRRRA